MERNIGRVTTNVTKRCALTVEELRALAVAFFHLFAFVGSCLHVAVSHGEHRGSGLHEELAHLHIVAGSGAVERRPAGEVARGKR